MSRVALAKFAADAGVVIVQCEPGWGGRWGYKERDWPSCTTCGFKTKREALEGWANSTFGESTAKALLNLLEAK